MKKVLLFVAAGAAAGLGVALVDKINERGGTAPALRVPSALLAVVESLKRPAFEWAASVLNGADEYLSHLHDRAEQPGPVAPTADAKVPVATATAPVVDEDNPSTWPHPAGPAFASTPA